MSGTTTMIDLYCFGVRSAAEAGLDNTSGLRLKPAGQAGTDSIGHAELQKQLNRGTTEWVALADASHLAELPEAASALEEIVCTPEPPGAGMHLHLQEQTDDQTAGKFSPAALLQQLPPRLGPLVIQPELAGVILARRADLTDAIEAEIGTDTERTGLWPLLAALPEAGKSFHLLCSKVEPALPSLLQQQSPTPAWLQQKLLDLDPRRLIRTAVSAADATAVLAGLLLLHDLAEQSHAVSQSVQGQGRRQAGDCWHMIVHRREPDYSNARYWCRQFGMHPAATELAGITEELLNASSHPDATGWSIRLTSGGMWHATEFVDLCSRSLEVKDRVLIELTRQIQYAEILLLLGESYRDATMN